MNHMTTKQIHKVLKNEKITKEIKNSKNNLNQNRTRLNQYKNRIVHILEQNSKKYPRTSPHTNTGIL